MKHDHRATLFIEAGAGTGKTSVLVSRITDLVASGTCALKDIAAITFTEAAAAELRERLHDELVGRIESSDDSDLALTQALGELDEAAITTIHGFAQRILAEHPIEAGLPLRIRVLDEIESFLAFDRRFGRFLDALFDEPEARPLLTAAVHVGVTPENMRDVMRSLDEMWEVGPNSATKSDNEGFARTILDRVDAAVGVLEEAIGEALSMRSACVDPTDKLFLRLDELSDAVSDLKKTHEIHDRLSWLFEFRPPRAGNVGRKDAWAGIDVAEVREAFVEIEQERASAVGDLVDVILRALTERLLSTARAWSLERKAAGELSFHDLLVLARDLLDHNDKVRRALRERFKRIFVDEFQDTDPLQLEIVRLLGAEEKGGDVDAGRLFFVGDPKQSIYRFRGADAEVYETARKAMVGGDPDRLTTNFRSVPGLIDFVNGVFSELFNKVSGAEAFGPYTAMQSARKAASSVPPVLILGGPSEEKMSASERRIRESFEIASTITHAITDSWSVEDSSGVRPARYGDMAILVPRRTGLTELEDALEAQGIPYRLDSQALIYDSIEVRDLLACLRAVDERADEPAIVAALRTPEFACSDRHLLAYRRAGGEWQLDAEAPAELAQSRVALALSSLRSIASERHVRGILGTLESIVTSRRVLQLCMGSAHPQDAIRRINFVVSQTRAFVDAGGSTIAELSLWMSLQGALGARTVEPSSATSGEDAVKILTIHGAKGLEFPIVVLAELGGSRSHGSFGPTVLRSRAGHVEVHLRNGQETKGYGSVALDEETRAATEELRLCYVAATRARDHLVISLHHHRASTEGARSLAEIIYGACENRTDAWRASDEREASAKSPAGTKESEEDRSGLSDEALVVHFEAEERRFASLVERAAIAPSVSASALTEGVGIGHPRGTSARKVMIATRDDDERDGGDLRASEARQKANALGRVVHAMLQRVDLTTGADLDDLAQIVARGEGCEERVDEARALVRVALRAPSVIAARSVELFWRELPVTVVVGNRLLECVIDLCYIKDGYLVIVDYKTDALANEGQAPEIASRYRLQVGAYALALSSVLSIPVGRCVLLFLSHDGEPIEVDIEDVEAAMADACEAIVGNMFPRVTALAGGGDDTA
jgi:ATP-dependent helicase/nuclease subunit A